MTEGGYGPKEIELQEQLDRLKAASEEPPEDTQETSFTYDTNTQYNTDDTNLETNDDFSRPGQASLREQSEAMREHNLRTQAQVETLIVTEYQRFAKEKGWEYTKTGLKLLAERSTRRGGRLFYIPDSKEFDVKNEMTKKQRENNSNSRSFCLSETNNPNKFLPEDRIKSKWGVKFVNHLKRLINTPDKTSWYSYQLEHMDNEPSTRQTQPISQDTQTAISSFVERLDKSTNTKDLVKNLKDAPDTELSTAGFSEEDINQVRDSVEFIKDAQTIIAEKDMKIGELKKQIRDNEDKIANLRKEIIKSKEKNISFMNKLEGDIKKVIEENKELRKQLEVKTKEAFELLSGEESQVKRLKYLIRDVLKNPDSRISLKDRIKSLFKLDGITIGSIITAVVATITSIALAISLSLKSIPIAPKPKPPGPPKPDPQPGPDPKPDIPNKVKEGLKKFAEWLKELAKKSFAALPAIIGSIVSFILKSAAAAVGFLAEHMIILVIIIVSSIVYGLVEGVRYIKESGK